MNTFNWIWPISWYRRIKRLEMENQILRNEYKKLENLYRAEAIAHASALSAATASMMAMAAEHQQYWKKVHGR